VATPTTSVRLEILRDDNPCIVLAYTTSVCRQNLSDDLRFCLREYLAHRV